MASSDLCGAPDMHADKTLKANESEKKRKKNWGATNGNQCCDQSLVVLDDWDASRGDSDLGLLILPGRTNRCRSSLTSECQDGFIRCHESGINPCLLNSLSTQTRHGSVKMQHLTSSLGWVRPETAFQNTLR